MEKAAETWEKRAAKLQTNIQLNNYWALDGYLWRITTDITKIEEKCLIYTVAEMTEIKRYISKDLDKVTSAIKKFVPILEEDAKNVNKKFQSVMEKCRILRA
nr:uncharacterized protein LOC122269243 [Parasteatoda tepidariorum]